MHAMRVIDGVNRAVGQAAAWLILASVLVSAANAVMRKMFALSSNAMLEAQWYMTATAVMLGAAWVLQRNGHVRIELIAARFGSRTRRIVEIGGHVLLLLPVTLLMVWLATPYFLRSWAQNEGSINTGGLLVWPMRGIIVLGFAMLSLQAVSGVVQLLGGGPAPGEDDVAGHTAPPPLE